VAVGSQQFPIGTRIDVSSDLGLKDSTTVPRIHLAYRFSKRHRLEPERERGDSRTIELPVGDRHVLDFVVAQEPVQLEGSIQESAEFQDAVVDYDVWLVNNKSDGHRTAKRLQILTCRKNLPYSGFHGR
jgi:hypothetical protein